MSFSEQRKLDQRARARQIAFELCGSRYSRAIVRALEALVESVERDCPVTDHVPPASGARQVLQSPVQEVLF